MKSQVTHSPGSKLNLEVKITHPLIVPVRRVELLLIKSGCNIWTILSYKSFFLKEQTPNPEDFEKKKVVYVFTWTT